MSDTKAMVSVPITACAASKYVYLSTVSTSPVSTPQNPTNRQLPSDPSPVSDVNLMKPPAVPLKVSLIDVLPGSVQSIKDTTLVSTPTVPVGAVSVTEHDSPVQ